MKTMDNFDIALLSELSRSGRASHAELAKAVNLSPTACGRRQKQLEESGIIVGYQAVLGLRKLGLTTAVSVRISLDSHHNAALAAFESSVVACPAVTSCVFLSGADDYLITVEARDVTHFEHIHKTQLSRLPHVSRIQTSFAIREILTRNASPANLIGKRLVGQHA